MMYFVYVFIVQLRKAGPVMLFFFNNMWNISMEAITLIKKRYSTQCHLGTVVLCLSYTNSFQISYIKETLETKCFPYGRISRKQMPDVLTHSSTCLMVANIHFLKCAPPNRGCVDYPTTPFSSGQQPCARSRIQSHAPSTK